MMKRFEVGHTYYDQYACDHETLSVIKIVKRTPKTVVFERHGKSRRAKLYEDSNGEYIVPDHYSMACVYRAERELVDGEPATEEHIITADVPEACSDMDAADTAADAEQSDADNSIRFPAPAAEQPAQAPAAGYAVADALVRYTVRQAAGVLFGGCELRAKELDFLMALTDRAGRVVK